MAAVACSPISDFLSSIVTGLSLWVSFLLHMITALCSPIGGFLHSDRIVPIGISPAPYGDSSLLPHGRIPPLLHDDAWPIIHGYLLLHMVAGPYSPYADSSLSHTLGGSYLLPHECLSSTSSGSTLLPYKWISLLFSPTVTASAPRRGLPLPTLHFPIAPPSDLRSVVRGWARH
jgi:hypothetical protein